MNQTKPTESLNGTPCPFCAKGILALRQLDFRVETPEEPSFTVPDVWVDECSDCHEKVFPPESSRYIEQTIAEESEQLTPAELCAIRNALGVDQTEMSDILGLGGRTYHRWEKGTQYPSRSMGYYIRTISQFAEAFDWLRNREWRHKPQILQMTDYLDRFPDLASDVREGLRQPLSANGKRITNPARGLQNVAFGG